MGRLRCRTCIVSNWKIPLSGETCAALQKLHISIGLARAECLRYRMSLGRTLGALVNEQLDFVQNKVRELSTVVANRARSNDEVSPIDASAVRYVMVLVDAYEDLLSGFRRLTMPATNPASIAFYNAENVGRRFESLSSESLLQSREVDFLNRLSCLLANLARCVAHMIDAT